MKEELFDPGTGRPRPQGLYDPASEKDSCGVGFVVDIKGKKSHQIVKWGLEILVNLEHRGACGCEENTGDGAGMLLQVPHGFLSRECARLKIDLPAPGSYGVGMVFLPRDNNERNHCEAILEAAIRQEGQEVLGWRDVPVDDRDLGDTARRAEPLIRQVFVGRAKELTDPLAFERKLYVIRKVAEKRVREEAPRLGLRQVSSFYISSLSSQTIVYKGMLTASQLQHFFPDLLDESMESCLSLVHSRFSTNT
ncbi:MAG: glutamate synthase subunit alpha, partial [Bdellovibrionota bacterium]